MKTYNKLVRDNVVGVLERLHKHPVYETEHDNQRYLHLLFTKDREEAAELEEAVKTGQRNKIVEELVDKMEVWLAIAAIFSISHDELERARKKKHADMGGFKKRTVLMSADA